MTPVSVEEAESVLARFEDWHRKHPDGVMTVAEQWTERAAWTVLVLYGVKA